MFQPMPQALQHASIAAAVPAVLTGYMDPSTVQYGDLVVHIGAGDPVTFNALADETASAFFARVAAAGTAVDENGKNPLTVSFGPDSMLTLSSGARLRLSGNVMVNWIGVDRDIVARPFRTFDTDDEHVRTGDITLGERLNSMENRLLSPRGVVYFARNHSDYGTFVSKGATVGATIQVIHKKPDGSLAFHNYVIGEYDGLFDFNFAINNSATLNPDGVDLVGSLGKTVAMLGQGGGFPMLYSRVGGEISFYTEDQASLAAIIGSLPA